MAATKPSPLSSSYNNIEEHNNHKLKDKSRQEELGQEAFEYNYHEDEAPRPSRSSSQASVSSSSPSHEFSFTVSSLYTSPPTTKNVAKNSLLSYSSTSSAAAIDLSPAGEIFFRGHLLPLHLLSGGHLSSDNFLDSFTSFSNPPPNDSSMDQTAEGRAFENMEKPKSRSFSFLRSSPTTAKSRKSPENHETPKNRSKPHHDDCPKNLNSKTKFDLSNAIKRYVKLVRPLLIFRQPNSNSNPNPNRLETGVQKRGQSFSYSSNLSPRSNKQGAEILRGRVSAPASMRASPSNTGKFLEACRSNNSSSSSSDKSTMEELQAAIQAAIAHCKNSSIAAAAVQDKI